MESHCLDELGPLQTPGHVLWPNKQSHNLPDDDIFKELIDKGVVTIYMDDILILGGWTKEQHHEIVVQVLDILRDTASTSKQRNAPLSSLWSNTLASSSWKVTWRWTQSKLMASKTGQNVTEVQSFVGFINFYRCFV